MNTESRPGMRFLHDRAPVERVSRVTEIDLAKYLNVNTLLLDAEGTIVEQGRWDIDPQIVKYLRAQRASGQIQNIAIITNKKIVDEMSFLQLAGWTEQIDADISFVPLEPADRKPGPRMVLKALQHFNVHSSQALMVGDKSTADIRAANYAGVASVLVKRLGRADLAGDRFLRRPYEKVINSVTKKDDSSPRETPASIALAVMQRGREFVPSLSGLMGFGWDRQKISLELARHSDKISGYGGPLVYLRPEVEEAIPSPWHAPVVDAVNKVRKEHGREIADVLTESRRYLGPVIAGLIFLGKYNDTARKAARAGYVLGETTDFLDGFFAKGSRNGVTKEGGQKDEEIDKKFSMFVNTALTLIGRIKPKHSSGRLFRDTLSRQVIRPIFRRSGIDTSAVWSGKTSTAAEVVANTIAMGKSSQKFVDVTQELATRAKYLSAVHSAIAWILNNSQKDYDNLRAEQTKAELAEIQLDDN